MPASPIFCTIKFFPRKKYAGCFKPLQEPLVSRLKINFNADKKFPFCGTLLLPGNLPAQAVYTMNGKTYNITLR